MAESVAVELLRYEADIAFRRRSATIVDYLDPQPGDRILDAGCGLGFTLHLLAMVQPKARLFGLELRPDRMREAWQDRRFTGAELLAGDVTRLPLADASIDKLVLSEVLEHLRAPAGALTEAARVLRPGGVLAVTVPHRRYPFGWDPLNGTRERLGLGHFRDEPWSGIWTDHQRLYSLDDLRNQVAASGLTVTDVHLETRYSSPFAHHLVYGLGKAAMGRRGGSRRWDFWGRRPGLLLRAAIGAFTWPDRWNRERYHDGSAVGVCLRAVRA